MVVAGQQHTGNRVIFLKETFIASKAYYNTYFKEKRRVESEIWSVVDVKGKRVIDVGTGESTKKLAKLGARVIGIDNDLLKVKDAKESGIPSILCDILQFPFRKRMADLVVFYFTLHELSYTSQKKAIKAAKEMAPAVMVVEPSPKGSETYEKFARLWKEAMESVGKVEEYKPLEHWCSLLEDIGFKVRSKVVRWNSAIPPGELEKIIEATIKDWERINVRKKLILEFRSFLSEAKKIGMKWSDIYVLVGDHPDCSEVSP